jgi:DNA-binding response OmpR family regulator
MKGTADTASALRIALLEGDSVSRERVLRPGLAAFGFAVSTFATAASLRAQLQLETFQIALIGSQPVDGDGPRLVGEIRNGFPRMGIVLLVARGSAEKLRGLHHGADACLAEPVEIELLAASLRSLARRLIPASPLESKRWLVNEDAWCLVSPSGEAVALTEAERRVVVRLAATPGQVVTREELISVLTSNVYDFDTHRLDSLIYRLRRKVARACGQSMPLNAVHGQGYVFIDVQ